MFSLSPLLQLINKPSNININERLTMIKNLFNNNDDETYYGV